MEGENHEQRDGEQTISISRDENDIITDGISPMPIATTGGGTVLDLSGSPRGSDQDYTETLQDENVSLRRRLAETEYGFQRRLDRQTDLISKLQDKLKDSQRRMAEMETTERNAAVAAAASSPLSPPGVSRTVYRSSVLSTHVETSEEGVFSRLLEEQDKNSTLHEVNSTLRQEVGDMRSANFHLTSDLLRVTQLYDTIRQEVHRQSEEYKRTETTYVSHLATEHRQMLNLWRSLQQLRREFVDTRSMAMRGLSSMDSEMQRAVKNAVSAFRQFELRNAFVASNRALERAGVGSESPTSATSVEQLVWENIRRLTESQNTKEEELKIFQIKIEELLEEKRSLESHLSEKDKHLESVRRSMGDSKEERDDNFIDYLHNALRDMADSAHYHESPSNGGGGSTVSPRRRARSHSPRSLRGRAAAETTVRIVRDAFDRRQREIHELTGRLRSTQQRLADMKTTSGGGGVDRDRLERELNEAQARIPTLQRERDDALQQKEKYRSQLSSVQSDRVSWEKKVRDALEEQVATLNTQLESHQKRLLELESIESRLDEDNERLTQELDRFKADNTKLRALLDTSQSTAADTRNEIGKLKSVVARLERDNRELVTEASSATERASKEATKCEELTAELNRLSSTEKSLNDRLMALQLEVQTLARDKQSALRDRQHLQGRLEQLDGERTDLRSKRDTTEVEVRRMQEQVDLLQQDKMDLSQERTVLLSHVDRRNAELREFEIQLSALRKDYTETESHLKSATQKQHDLELQLESCRRDLITEQQFRSSTHEERRHLISEKTEVETRVTTLIEQVRRLESTSRQVEEKAHTELLEFERKLEEAESNRKAAEAHIAELNRKFEDIVGEKRSIESRSNSLQSILVSQEELLRSKENERRLAVGRVNQLEVQLRSREGQLKQVTDKFDSLNGDWEKAQLDMRKLKDDLNVSYEERRRHNAEVSELTSELHRTRIQLNEAVASAEAAEERIRSNLEQLRVEEQRTGRLQNEIEHCRSMLAKSTENENELRSQLDSVRGLLTEHTSSGQTLQEQLVSLQQQLRAADQEKRMTDDRLKDARDQLAKVRRDLKQRAEAFGGTESRVTELESKLTEMDSQLKTLQKMLDMSQETETDLKRQLEQTVAQKQSAQGRLSELQRKFHELETEKREWTSSKLRFERERTSLKHELAAYHKDRRKNDNIIRTAEMERAALDKAVSAIEKENMELHHTVTQLQAQVIKMEQAHAQRFSELSQRHRLDFDGEVHQLRADKQDALRQIDLLEKMYKQKLKSMEDQIARLKEQLRLEIRRRQEFYTRSIQQSRDVAQLRAGLDHSFASLRNDPLLDSLLLPSTGSHSNLGYSASTIRLSGGGGGGGLIRPTGGETNLVLTSQR